MNQLTAFQRDTIYVVGKLGAPYGLAIKDELEQYYECEINHGRLYPNLDDLIEMGLIDKGEQDGRTNQYDLTQRGVREIEARAEWEQQYVDRDS